MGIVLYAEQFACSRREFDALRPTTNREKAILVTLIATVTLVVAGTWIPVCNILNVDLLFLGVATFPGVQFVTWEEIFAGSSVHRPGESSVPHYYGHRLLGIERLRGSWNLARSRDGCFDGSLVPAHDQRNGNLIKTDRAIALNRTVSLCCLA